LTYIPLLIGLHLVMPALEAKAAGANDVTPIMKPVTFNIQLNASNLHPQVGAIGIRCFTSTIHSDGTVNNLSSPAVPAVQRPVNGGKFSGALSATILYDPAEARHTTWYCNALVRGNNGVWEPFGFGQNEWAKSSVQSPQGPQATGNF
jgi:hypothetical protein